MNGDSVSRLPTVEIDARLSRWCDPSGRGVSPFTQSWEALMGAEGPVAKALTERAGWEYSFTLKASGDIEDDVAGARAQLHVLRLAICYGLVREFGL